MLFVWVVSRRTFNWGAELSLIPADIALRAYPRDLGAALAGIMRLCPNLNPVIP